MWMLIAAWAVAGPRSLIELGPTGVYTHGPRMLRGVAPSIAPVEVSAHRAVTANRTVWVGLRSAPASWYALRVQSDGDMVAISVASPLLLADVSVLGGGERLRAGPFASAGLLAAETGARLLYTPGRFGLDARVGWLPPGSVRATVGFAVALDARRSSGPGVEPGPSTAQ